MSAAHIWVAFIAQLSRFGTASASLVVLWLALPNLFLPFTLRFSHYDLSWMEGIFRRLGTSSWPGYLRTSMFTPFAPAPGQRMSKLRREMSGGVSEVVGEMCKWKISLDVNHFAPSEITVKIQDGLLVVAGKHEEREDEHGYIARCFTRKYILPGGVEAESLQSFLSADGTLTVEATSPSIPLPADVNIPIQVLISSDSCLICNHTV
uniref:Si:dkey-1k23.3 n=1 Tax=Cyprinus carpio TaxID=7962 RepID=A0A8C2IQ41_CYPCA